MTSAPDAADRLLRLKEVEDMVGFKSSSIYRKMDAGTFPRPRKSEVGSVRWLQSEVLAWMRALPVAEKGHAA